MRIGILQSGRAPDALIETSGDYDQMFRTLLGGHGFEFETYAVLDGVFPSSTEAAEGWLITGSRFGVYEDHNWIPPLEQLIRDIHAKSLPMVGICFGHQIIAQALGGRVEKYDGGWAVGRVEYQENGRTIAMNAWHQDQVTALPPGAVAIASNDFCKNAAILYGDRAITVQAHPEFSADFVDGLINTRGRGVVPDAILDAAIDELDEPTHSQTIADQFADFFRQERPR